MKGLRHRKVLEIIAADPIETQEELAEQLRKNGFEVTQATVSRDIKELGLIKVPNGENRYRYAVPSDLGGATTRERLRRMFREVVTGFDASENLVVLRTLPGNAQGVASVIDNSRWPEVIGTVAGDDTIFLVIKPKESVPLILERIRKLV